MVLVPGNPNYGSWEPFKWNCQGQERQGIALVPLEAPWRRLFAALDDYGASLSEKPVALIDEVEAIVACCWRYGSYAHLLTVGESFPGFRSDLRLSRITDSEMKRINLEFSSGLAAWLHTRDSDPVTIFRRVRAAGELLPMPWHSRRMYRDLVLDYSELEDRIALLVEESGLDASRLEFTVRGEANRTVVWCYRNGAIENIHAGRASLGTEVPGMKRLYSAEVSRVCREIMHRLERQLSARDQFDRRTYRMFLFAQTWGADSGWSETEETSVAEFYGKGYDGSLIERVERLARRFPILYHGTLLQSARITRQV